MSGTAASVAFLAELLPASFLLRNARAQDANAIHLASTAKGASSEAVKEKIRPALQATRDLSLMERGDLVVEKVVSNMVTHPSAS